VRHRGFTHSLSFVGAAGIILLPLILMKRVDCYLAFLLSVLQHQILDGLTPDGLLWLTPFWNVPFRLSPNPSLTIPNGSGKEGVLRWCLISLMLMLLVINLIGPRWMLNYYFADTQAAIELIYRWGSRYSLKARFKATHMLTQEEIEGYWHVVGHSDRKLILETAHGELRQLAINKLPVQDWTLDKMNGFGNRRRKLGKTRKGARDRISTRSRPPPGRLWDESFGTLSKIGFC